MTLWLVFAIMTAAAVIAVLWPLHRSGVARRGGSDVVVYQDQLTEIERDRAAGRIGEREAEAARIEVSRRLLAAADAVKAQAHQPEASATWRRRAAAVAALVVLRRSAPLRSIARSARPTCRTSRWRAFTDAHRAAFDRHAGQPSGSASGAQSGRRPRLGSGRPVYMRLGRFDGAVTARQNVLRLLGSTVAREVELGEALAPRRTA